MDKDYESTYHAVEERHWWFRARRDFVFQLLQRHDKHAPLLEVGCSGAPLLLRLRQAGFTQLKGIDISVEGIALAHQRGFVTAQVMDAEHTTFSTAAFACIVASDVLEHIANDVSALREWHRLLQPGGRLYVFVPSFMFLWSGHDAVNLHQRRYTADGLRNVLQQAGFTVLRTSYWNFFLFLPIAILRIIKRTISKMEFKPIGDLQAAHPVVNSILYTLLRLENFLLRFLNLPFGISVFCVAHKPAA